MAMCGFCQLPENEIRDEAPRSRRRRRTGGGVWGRVSPWGYSLLIIPLSSRLGGLGERRELLQRGPGWSPGRKRIWGILSVAEGLWLKENQVFRKTFYNGLALAHGPLLDINWLK